MFLRIITRSIRNRKTRIGVAVLAVLLGGSLISALISISLEVGSKVGRELRAYGANVLVSPKVASAQTGIGSLEFGAIAQERYLQERDVEAIESGDRADEIVAHAPYLYGLVEINGMKVALAGTRFQAVRETSPWWQVEGGWAEDASGGETGSSYGMIGANIARELKLSPGDEVEFRFGPSGGRIKVAGVVETGGPEENQVFVPMRTAEEILGKPGLISLVQVSVTSSGRSLSEVAKSIEERVPGSQAKVIGQIADAEASVLGKIQLLMALVALLVLLASGLAVGSTLAASVLERTKEIGLMKALGADNRHIASLFLVETAVIATIGGVLGYLLGLGLAQIVGRSVFGSAVSPHPLAVLATLLVALSVSLLASLVPIRRALDIDPAITLKGE